VSDRRGKPLPDVQGDELVHALLAEIDEEERLGAAIGVDLAPADARPEHASAACPPLAAWLRRAEEVHAYLERQRRAERARTAG
jgi:hypothetical protein